MGRKKTPATGRSVENKDTDDRVNRDRRRRRRQSPDPSRDKHTP